MCLLLQGWIIADTISIILDDYEKLVYHIKVSKDRVYDEKSLTDIDSNIRSYIKGIITVVNDIKIKSIPAEIRTNKTTIFYIIDIIKRNKDITIIIGIIILTLLYIYLRSVGYEEVITLITTPVLLVWFSRSRK